MTAPFPFTSLDPKPEDPTLSWKNFQKPKLWRFPKPEVQLQEYVGGGEDGLVFKSQMDGQDVAIKVFRHNRQPDPVLGARLYFPFERECLNCALLDLIGTSIQRAVTAGKAVYLRSKPKTRKQALRNLFAFTDEGAEQSSQSPNREPFTFDERRINRCFGWTRVSGLDVNQALWRAGVLMDISDDVTYYAIVYEFVPKARLDADKILVQHDFFHLAGFYSVTFNPTNWLADGVLVDFSDLVSPFVDEGWWRERSYGENLWVYPASVRSLAKKGDMRWW
ncbi:hypothetical protein ACJ41O_010289 [Fusarium nematophilum]